MKKSKDSRPLDGIRVLVTRERSQAPELSRALSAQGAIPVECPTISCVPPEDWSQVDRALHHLDRYDMIVFTSSNAVRFFTKRLVYKGISLDRLSHLSFWAIGPATAQELAHHGISTGPLPEEYLAEGLIEMLKTKGVRGKRILFPRAEVGRDLLPQQLREQGAMVDLVVAYQTKIPMEHRARLVELLKAKAVDAVTFTSPSTAKNFAEMVDKDRLPELLADIPVACIGTITATEARAQGLEVSITPKEHTISALVLAVASFYRRKAKGQRRK